MQDEKTIKKYFVQYSDLYAGASGQKLLASCWKYIQENKCPSKLFCMQYSQNEEGYVLNG